MLCALPQNAQSLRRDAEINEVRREGLRRGLEALGSFVYPSGANFLLADLRCSAASVAERLRGAGILVRECMDFSGINDGRHLRLAVKDEASNRRLLYELKGAMTCAENL